MHHDRALGLDGTSFVMKSCFSAPILVFDSLSRRLHPKYTWSKSELVRPERPCSSASSIASLKKPANCEIIRGN